MPTTSQNSESSSLSDELITELTDTYRMLDGDSIGKITNQQMVLALKCFGLPMSRELTERIGENRDDIGFEEYISIFGEVMDYSHDWCKAEACEVVSILDPNSSGSISVQTVKRFMHEIGEVLKNSDISEELKLLDNTLNDENVSSISSQTLTDVLVSMKTA